MYPFTDCVLQATDNMKVGMAQASIERNHAVQQMMRLKQELDQADRDRHAVSVLSRYTQASAGLLIIFLACLQNVESAFQSTLRKKIAVLLFFSPWTVMKLKHAQKLC
jgi:hypothetical protein